MFRKAKKNDIKKIEYIYNSILSNEESGPIMTGWRRNIYPTYSTAENALTNDELYVYEEDGEILASGIINKKQGDMYKFGNWKIKASDNEILVLHTLVVSPDSGKKGIGKEFVKFYEQLASDLKCKVLRIDTNELNTIARNFYNKLGYSEVGIVECDFNGLSKINLVLLEKKL